MIGYSNSFLFSEYFMIFNANKRIINVNETTFQQCKKNLKESRHISCQQTVFKKFYMLIMQYVKL